MWQFAMNTPANGNGPAAFAGDGGARLINRLPALACFAVLATLHFILLSAFDFSPGRERAFAETEELFITLDFPDSGPEEAPGVAPVETPLPASPPPQEEELLPPEPLPLEKADSAAPVAEAVAVSAVPATAFPPAFAGSAAGNVGDAGASGGGAAPERKAPMTDAEYLALIMGRLEKNKIYPLSVRKRGIEGDITAAFTIRRDGSVSELRLADPSGHRFLVQAAFETIRSASPFPVMEGRAGDYTVQVSIRYRLEDEDA
jgi:TonB family protein